MVVSRKLDLDDEISLANKEKDSLMPPFKVDERLNGIIYLTQDNITKIDCDAIAIPNNEKLSDRTSISTFKTNIISLLRFIFTS